MDAPVNASEGQRPADRLPTNEPIAGCRPYFFVPLAAGTGEVPVVGPAVDVSGGGTASAFEPLPAGAAPVGGIGARTLGSAVVEPGSVSTFEPEPVGGA